MITEEEYRKAKAIILQYAKERREIRDAIREKSFLSFEENHPIAERGDFVEITGVHTSGTSKHLKIGAKFRVLSVYARRGYVLYQCKKADGKESVEFKSDNYDWKIVSKAAE